MKDSMRTVDVEIQIRPKGRNRAHASVPAPSRIPRITRLMALAIKFQDMVDRGEVRDYADLARLGYVSRARLTQIMNLLLLAPDLQEFLLTLDIRGKQARFSEQSLRVITRFTLWQDQREEASARNMSDPVKPNSLH